MKIFQPIVSGSLNVFSSPTASVIIRTIPTNSTVDNIVLYDSESGQLYYTTSYAQDADRIVNNTVEAKVQSGTGTIFSVVSGSNTLFSITGGTNTGSIVINTKGLNFDNAYNGTQIRIGTTAAQAGGESTRQALIAIGYNAGTTFTTGSGQYSIFIGKNAGNGMSGNTADGVTYIGSGDADEWPQFDNGLILLAGRGFENNDVTRSLGISNIPSGRGFAVIGGGNVFNRYVSNFYFGGAPFLTNAELADVAFYAPSATGIHSSSADFTINAGRGTGTGSAGDFYIAVASGSAASASLQPLSNRFMVKGGTGEVGIGTTSPTGALNISLRNSSTGSTNGSGSHIVISNTNTNAGQSIISFVYGNNTRGRIASDYDGNMYYGSGPANAKHVFSVNNNFAVGAGIIKATINSTDSDYSFDVNGTAADGVGYLALRSNGIIAQKEYNEQYANNILVIRKTISPGASQLIIPMNSLTNFRSFAGLSMDYSLMLYSGSTEFVYANKVGNLKIQRPNNSGVRPNYIKYVDKCIDSDSDGLISIDDLSFTASYGNADPFPVEGAVGLYLTNNNNSLTAYLDAQITIINKQIGTADIP